MFSVVIPLYNKRNHIEKAVESVLGQEFGDYEVIIVDDGSTDGSQDIIDGMEHSKLKIIHQENRGVAEARNTGIRNAVNDYICFLDADDKWLPNHLSEIKKLIEKYPMAGLYSTIPKIILKDGSSIVNTDRNLPELVHDYLGYICGHKMFIHTNSVCVKRNVFDEVGYFTSGEKLSEDISMWHRIALCHDIAIRQIVTNEYHRENSQVSENACYNESWKFPEIAEELVRGHPIEKSKIESLEKCLARYSTGVCIQQCRNGNKKAAIRTFNSIDRSKVQLERRVKMVLCLACPKILLAALPKRK